MTLRIALLYPPTCDPTAPYLSLPTLTGWLRAHGFEVLPVDVNIEAWDKLLRKESLQALGQRLLQRLDDLNQRPSLSHREQLDYSAIWQVLGELGALTQGIEKAVRVLRDPSGEPFFDPQTYQEAVSTVQGALRVVGAAYSPLEIDFLRYRTPFSLLNSQEIDTDARAERNPFHAIFESIVERLAQENVGLIGLSVAFPGQIQSAYALAKLIRKRLPEVHLTVGGPAMTQLLLRLKEPALQKALLPFDSAVLFEGEQALLTLAEQLQDGTFIPQADKRIIGQRLSDLGQLPAPDFDGLPLDLYLSPKLVLPYDPSRGCYWGKCAFCHYGLAEVGTARYQERPLDKVYSHLKELSEKYKTNLFYFSQDGFAPKTARRLASGLYEQGIRIRWATDMRPERVLTLEVCQELARGGALAFSLGVESASARVLSLIHKGVGIEDVRRAIENLSAVGIAAEAMCFTDFPTETHQEALSTLRFLEEMRRHISLFICGQFELTAGSAVAQNPEQFGIQEVWRAKGDEFGTALFYKMRQEPKRPNQRAHIDEELETLAQKWSLRPYPWAGSLSTAHSLLWYERFGAGAFRKPRPEEPAFSGKAAVHSGRFDVEQVIETSSENEAQIWGELVFAQRHVSRAAYQALASKLSPLMPAPGKWRCEPGQMPERLEERVKKGHGHRAKGPAAHRGRRVRP